MKIDLEKELEIGQAAARARLQPHALLSLPGIALLVAFVALGFALHTPTPAPTPACNPSTGLMDTQIIARTDARIRVLERAMHDLRTTVIEYKMSMKELVAKQKKDNRRNYIRMDGKADTNVSADIQAAAQVLSPNYATASVVLTDEEKKIVDMLTDRDESGTQVRAFVRAVTNVPRQNAYVAYLVGKGDAWISSALALADDSADFELYADNALYFYDIAADVSADNGVIAYAEAKRSQIRFERQRRAMRLSSQQETERLQEQLKALEQRLADQEEREQKRYGPPPPPIKRVYKP